MSAPAPELSTPSRRQHPIVLAFDAIGAGLAQHRDQGHHAGSAAVRRLATVGGKRESLARLTRAGLPVSPGFHVTTAAYRRPTPRSGRLR